MSYPGASNGVSITEYIEKCTDEHLQQPDYAAFSNVCDLLNNGKIEYVYVVVHSHCDCYFILSLL